MLKVIAHLCWIAALLFVVFPVIMIWAGEMTLTGVGKHGTDGGGGPPPVGGECTGTNYFVSNAGNDGANGTSTPWRTVGKVNSARFNAGDCINFNGGDTFTDANLTINRRNIASATPINPVSFQSYGTGKATIKSATGGDISATIYITSVNGFSIRNLIIRPGTGLFGACPGGIGANCTNNGIYVTGASTGTVDNNDIGGFYVNDGVTIGGGDICSGFRTDSSGNVTVSNNIFHGLTANATDDDGVQINGSSGNITIIGNEFYNFGGRPSFSWWGGEAINAVNQKGGYIAIVKNKVHDIAYNYTTQCGAGSGIETANVMAGEISYNEVYRVQINNTTGCDGDGIDLDGSTRNWIVQGNYTHDNVGAGIYAWMGLNGSQNWTNNTYRYNISVNDHYGIALTNSGATNPVVYVYNNTVYHTPSAPGTWGVGGAFFLMGGPGGSYGGGPTVGPGSTFENNLLIETSTTLPLAGCNGGDFSVLLFKNNAYYTPNGSFQMAGNHCHNSGGAEVVTLTSLAAWQAYANGGDTGATTANPLLAGAAPSGGCTWTPSTQPATLGACAPGLKLQSGSPLIGAGISISNQGSKDFFNFAIPNGVGSGINISAYGGP